MERRAGPLRRLIVVVVAICLSVPASATDDRFTIAMIPDTQNYLDYRHQRGEGFPFDANAMFLEQMRYIADNVESVGGEIAFVTAVGDVWQHQSLPIDPGHEKRGFRRLPHPVLDEHLAPTPKTRSSEMPIAQAGYQLIAGKVPFSVVPGNHDYDAMWFNPPRLGPQASEAASSSGSIHVGGLSNFNSVFGSTSTFFANKPWYVAAHDGGADSAQVFRAGGYRFLHIGLQFDPPNASLRWAASVIRRFRGLPTIISTHDYLNTAGERRPNPSIDAAALDPQDNSPEMVWQKLISQHDQIFMVLCGHQHGQTVRVDRNRDGKNVYQILADYQSRGQTAKDAGISDIRTPGVGDGWMRLMEFDMSGTVPLVRVRTYSTHYKRNSIDTPQYARWYKAKEKPELSDEAFHREDDFQLRLTDFHARFDRHGRAASQVFSNTASDAGPLSSE
jgi:hypothetical protein